MMFAMSAPSTLMSSLQQKLSANSVNFLQTAGISPSGTATTSPPQAAVVQDDEKLRIFDSIIDEIEQKSANPVDESAAASALFASVTPQALPQATEEMWQQAQPQPQGGQTGKERTAGTWSLDSAVQESGGMLTAVEQEKQPEISPEVESYMQRVENTQESPAEELAKLIPTVVSASSPAQTEVVRVLPISKSSAVAGHAKSPKFSIRWLVEWSDKVIKMFQGKAVYRTSESPSK